MNIGDLPVEVLDIILSHLDAVSLERSRQVCRTWRKLHEQAKYAVLWKKACVQDIPRDILLELVGCNSTLIHAIKERKSDWCYTSDGVEPDPNVLLKSLNWKNLYKDWYRSRKVGEWPQWSKSVQVTSSALICDAKLSGDKIICGGEDGVITVRDRKTGVSLMKLIGHVRAVLSIALRIKPGTCYYSEKIHDLIISGSVDTTIKVWAMDTGQCLTTLRCHRNPVKCVEVLDHYAVSCANEDFVQVWDIIQGIQLRTLSAVAYCFNSVKLWEDKVLASTSSGKLYLWSLKTYKNLIKLAVPSSENCMLAGCVLRGNVVMALTSDGRIFVWELQNSTIDSKIDNFTEYSFSTLGPSTRDVSTRVCLTMRGSLVAMATSTGTVFLYHVDGRWEKQFRQVKAVVHTGMVGHSLSTIAISDNGEGPCLLTVHSDGQLKFHRWYPPSSVHIEK